jgi:hypothetical protein
VAAEKTQLTDSGEGDSLKNRIGNALVTNPFSILWSRHSSVNITTGWITAVTFPLWVKRLQHPYGPWGPPTLLSNIYQCFISGLKRLERDSNHRHTSAAVVKNDGAIIPLLQTFGLIFSKISTLTLNLVLFYTIFKFNLSFCLLSRPWGSASLTTGHPSIHKSWQ